MDFYDVGIKRFVPVMSGEKKHKKPLWLTKRVTRSIKKRYQLWKKFKEYNKESDYIKYA